MAGLGVALAETAAREDQAIMIAVCQVSDVPTEGGLRVELQGRPALAVFRVGLEYFITDNLCTHGDASLSDGEVVGTEIECPFHRGSFDLRTGLPTGRPCMVPLRTYKAEVRGEVVFGELPPL